MIKNIYVDMDGVLCNFDKRYMELFNEDPDASRDRKEFTNNWTDFVMGKNFETLEYFPGAQDLINYLHKLKTVYNINIEILSSSGGEKYHDIVEKQKQIWLKTHGINFKPNIVSGRKKKAAYATSDSLLIDDTPDVIEAFKNAGGKTILHRNSSVTMGLIREMLLFNA